MNPIIGKKVIKIEGMHCDHCKQKVTSALNDLGKNKLIRIIVALVRKKVPYDQNTYKYYEDVYKRQLLE